MITRIDTGTRMSKTVIHNGSVYLCGQVGVPGTDTAEQTREILRRIEAHPDLKVEIIVTAAVAD